MGSIQHVVVEVGIHLGAFPRVGQRLHCGGPTFDEYGGVLPSPVGTANGIPVGLDRLRRGLAADPGDVVRSGYTPVRGVGRRDVPPSPSAAARSIQWSNPTRAAGWLAAVVRHRGAGNFANTAVETAPIAAAAQAPGRALVRQLGWISRSRGDKRGFASTPTDSHCHAPLRRRSLARGSEAGLAVRGDDDGHLEYRGTRTHR